MRAEGRFGHQRWKELAALVQHHGHVTVGLNDTTGWPLATRDVVIAGLLPVMRLLQSASVCRLYDRPSAYQSIETQQFLGRYTKRDRRALTVDLSNPEARADVRLWMWASGEGANAVLGIPRQGMDADILFASTWNPGVHTNLGSVVARATIRFGKELAAASDSIGLIPWQHAYGLSLEVFASREHVQGLLDIAGRRARLTPEYCRLYDLPGANRSQSTRSSSSGA